MSTKSFEAASNIQNASNILISISVCVDTTIHAEADTVISTTPVVTTVVSLMIFPITANVLTTV